MRIRRIECDRIGDLANFYPGVVFLASNKYQIYDSVGRTDVDCAINKHESLMNHQSCNDLLSIQLIRSLRVPTIDLLNYSR